MTARSPSGVTVLLAHLGVERRQVPAVCLIIAMFEVTIVGLAVVQAFLERAFHWPPTVVFILFWVVWTWWHSWLFPRHRLRYLEHARNPYRRAFIRDIYPWVSAGFSQMWRPLINGDTLDRLLGGRLTLDPWALSIGMVVCFAALLIMVLAIRTIGIGNAAFLREFVAADTFVPIDTGIYSAIMHPLFWAGIAYSCGLAIAVSTRQSYAIAAINVVYGILYIRLENRRLARIFGSRYESYRARTASVIPWLR